MTEVIVPDSRRILGFGNRESLDIIDRILVVCLNGTMKTHAMYRCGLNSKQMQDYLELLLKFRLLETGETEEGRTKYQTTERGKRFIEAYAALFEIFYVVQEG